MSKPVAERVLVILMRLTGAAMLLALPAAFMPRSWMAATHEWVGMGAFPAGAVVDYLARSLCFFYAAFGAFFWLFSFDPARYAPAIRLQAWLALVGGVLVTALDLYLRLPIMWTIGEGPFTVLLGIILLVCIGKVEEAD